MSKIFVCDKCGKESLNETYLFKHTILAGACIMLSSKEVCKECLEIINSELTKAVKQVMEDQLGTSLGLSNWELKLSDKQKEDMANAALHKSINKHYEENYQKEQMAIKLLEDSGYELSILNCALAYLKAVERDKRNKKEN